MWFLNAFFAMCGIACGMPLLFISSHWCRKWSTRDTRFDEYQQRSIELMAERNVIDEEKLAALKAIATNIWERKR